MKKTFLLGVGAQKSGTTWLHRYLSENKNVNFGACKEYHIWDALYIKECRGFIAHENDELRYTLQNTDGAYESYFSSLMGAGIQLTGDITPSYSGLPADCFGLIRNKLERSGFDIKVVFLMRDPFERCWSAVRMWRRNGKTESPEIEQLRCAYQSGPFILRTNYKATIESLESAFDMNQIYYGIYEELFDFDKLKSLSDFIGVSFNPELTRKKFNSSPKCDYEASVLREEIREFYSHVYDFCFERFPQTKSLWGLER
jgi:hypothetical protein